ncbi:MAG: helix-turn-helix domain-containing protein [Bacteroidales bacterium]
MENRDLQLAFEFVRYTNRNIFLTGKAGTGKTTFLRELKNTAPKRMVVVAPTGVAAINAGGVTIHSFFQLPFHPYIPTFYLPQNVRPNQAEQVDPAGHKMSREKINIIRSLDLLIIDEISMVRADTLDAIDSALRRYKHRHLPFGGVQLLMIGDLQQLAPVVKEDDRELMGKYYDSFFFFGSHALAATSYVTIELKHIYRQSDRLFIDILNKIRDNIVDNEVLDELNKRYFPDFDPDTGGGYITLTTHNNQARTINDSKLDKLPGRARSFSAIVKDEFPELSYPNSSELLLKKGAQVMFVKNDISPEKLFFNGKIGKVIGFEDDFIIVKCPEDEYPITVEMVEWQNMKYSLDEETKEIEETVIGTFTQYPLRLAWAITIHKSQGLTFDRAVIDAAAAFAHGQVYVALSRCRSLDGLILSSRIIRRNLIDNPVVSGFINESIKNQPGEEQLEEAKRAYQQQLLAELFDFKSLARALDYSIKAVKEHRESLLDNPLAMLEDSLSLVHKDILEISGKFEIQLRAMTRGLTNVEADEVLQERVRKAAVYFSGKIEASLKEIIDGYEIETDNRTARKAVSESFDRLRKESITKLACLDSARAGFSIGKYLDARARAELDIPAAKPRKEKRKDETPGAIENRVLFNRIKEWRATTARELGVAHFIVLHQKTIAAITEKLPRTIKALGKVKGMGKKKTAKFGEELLEIIENYCRENDIPGEEEPVHTKGRTKKVKPDTKKISLDMFREGMSVEAIAEERGLSISTVENHLEHFVSTGELPVTALVSDDKIRLITAYFEEVEDLRLGPGKEVLGDEVTWGELRFVAGHLRYLAGKENGEL